MIETPEPYWLTDIKNRAWMQRIDYRIWNNGSGFQFQG